jgi:predicted transcriptional regulator of viral defense system
MSVVRASKKLELKVCTARSILSKYKKKGIIYDKKEKKHIVPDLPRREESEHLNSSIEDEAEEV